MLRDREVLVDGGGGGEDDAWALDGGAAVGFEIEFFANSAEEAVLLACAMGKKDGGITRGPSMTEGFFLTGELTLIS